MGSLRRSFGAATPTGVSVDTGNFALSLIIPLGNTGHDRAQAADCVPDPHQQELPAIDAKPDPSALPLTPEDRPAAPRQALVAAGLPAPSPIV